MVPFSIPNERRSKGSSYHTAYVSKPTKSSYFFNLENFDHKLYIYTFIKKLIVSIKNGVRGQSTTHLERTLPQVTANSKGWISRFSNFTYIHHELFEMDQKFRTPNGEIDYHRMLKSQRYYLDLFFSTLGASSKVGFPRV